MAERIQKLLTTSPVNLVKKTKAGEKEIDIIPMINDIGVRYDNDSDTLKITCTLSAASAEYLNPEMLITAMKKNIGVMSGNPAHEWYTIMRTELLKSDMTRFE